MAPTPVGLERFDLLLIEFSPAGKKSDEPYWVYQPIKGRACITLCASLERYQ